MIDAIFRTLAMSQQTAQAGLAGHILPGNAGCPSRLWGNRRRHILTIPLARMRTGANTHDVTQFLLLVDAIPPLSRDNRGLPRSQPKRGERRPGL